MPKTQFEASFEWYERQKSSGPAVDRKLEAAISVLQVLGLGADTAMSQAMTLVIEELRTAQQLHKGYMEPF